MTDASEQETAMGVAQDTVALPFVAMNRFRVVRGAEATFEEIWRNRDSKLAQTPGFVSFHLLKGPQAADHTLYCSHSVWTDRAAFEGWMRSAQFRSSHRDAGGSKTLYLGPPDFEAFEPVPGV